MPELPPHNSPVIAPLPRPSNHFLASWGDHDHISTEPFTPPLPDNILSPAFTPPSTPGLSSGLHTPHNIHNHFPKSHPVDTSLPLPPGTKLPRLLDRLPHVECIVRARIPTTSGAEMFLHLYQNDVDNKEHLAIVFGSDIRSRSLDAERPGETEMDRMIRGAYVGRLRPGRVSSRRDDAEEGNGWARRTRSLLKNVKTLGDSTAVLVNGAIPENASTALLPSDLPKPSLQTSPSAPSTTAFPINADQNTTQTSPSPSTPSHTTAPLVRIHSECYTGETAWSARCDCGEQLDEAARLMSMPTPQDPSVPSRSNFSSPITSPQQIVGGVIVYLRQEGRGIGLASKLAAYNLQDLGSDTIEANLLLRHPADARSYGLATAMLVDLGLGTEEMEARGGPGSGIRLLTNNPEKVRAVEGPAREVRVVGRVPMVPKSWRKGAGPGGIGAGKELERYLDTKIRRMGHMIWDEEGRDREGKEVGEYERVV